MRLEAPAFVVLLAAAAVAAAAAETSKSDGAICIAPFQAAAALEENMSQTTWPPSASSKFEFRIDGRLAATVADGEMAHLEGLPTDRRVRVQVSLDAKQYETFGLNLGASPGHRVCLWLRTGYWHWIDVGWDESRGCECQAAAAPATRELEIVATTLDQSTSFADDVPVLVLHFDPMFQMRIRVDRVAAGASPLPVGSQLALRIHSPAQTYVGDPTGTAHTYRFRVVGEGDGAEYTLESVDGKPVYSLASRLAMATPPG